MQHPLHVGQVFRCPKFRSLVHEIDRDASPPKLDKTRLHFDSPATVRIPWTEKGPDGWERKHEHRVEVLVEDPESLAWESFTVTEVDLTGGGNGHGPNDVYPDGHRVTARGTSGRTVRFYQTGCFTGIVKPEDVELLDGPPDVPGRWRKVFTAEYETQAP